MGLLSRSAALLLTLLAVLLAATAALYAFGYLNILTTHPNATHHYQHAIVIGVLALACLVGASVFRRRPR